MAVPVVANPDVIAPPIGKYSHLVTPPPDCRLVMVSGQVGNLADGTLAGPDALSQTRQVFANIEALLGSVGAGPRNIVKLLTFVAGTEHLPGFYAARDELFARWYPDGRYPGHSLAVVAALAAPDLAVEIEGVIAVPAGDHDVDGEDAAGAARSDR